MPAGPRDFSGPPTQEIFTIALRRWAKIATYDRPDLWVRRAMINRAISERRKRASESNVLARLVVDHAGVAPMKADPSGVWRLVGTLPRRQAQALALVYGDDMSIEDTANAMRCSAGAVKTHLHRGRAALALVVGVVAITQLRERKAIAPASPLPTAPGDAINSSAPDTTEAATNLSVPAATVTTSTVTTSTAAVTTTSVGATVSEPDPGALALADVADEHHLAALGTIPEGYRVASANRQPQLAGSTVGSGSWTVTYVRRPVDGQLLSYISAAVVRDANGDTYTGLVDETQPEATVGAFVGRWFNSSGGEGFANFAAPLGGGWLLEVGGRATHDEVEAMITTLRVDPGADPPTIEGGAPAGFSFADEGDDSVQSPGFSSSIIYAKGHAQSTAITIRTSVDPAKPAVLTALGPDRVRIIDVKGVVGFLVHGALTFDVTPTYQVSLTVGGPASWSYSEDIDLLGALARSIVGVDETTFEQYHQAASTDPFIPTDGDCESYLMFTNAHSDTGSPTADGTIDVMTPGTVTVTVSATQPLANLDFFVQALGKLIPIGTLAALDGSATVELTWDGTIDGQPAPAAPYTMIAVRADPADPTVPDVCNRHSDEPHLSPNGLPTYDYGSSFSIGASFVVAEQR